MKSAKEIGPTPTGSSPVMKPTFTPGIPNGPTAPPDQTADGVYGVVGFLNTEADINGVQKKGL